jgi:hypothetical protein
MKCKICEQTSTPLFSAKVLNEHQVQYYKCSHCKFIQTEEPYWLAASYSSAITQLDIGLIQRNMELSKITAVLINTFFNTKNSFIDFAGGYGMLVRMMRDFGYSFFRQDKYCENTFSKNFDVTDQKETKFELLTAFEVFEHLENPMHDIDEMLSYSNNILFSTILQPHDQVTPSNWWYISPEIGQHISLFHRITLENIAKHKGLYFYTNGKNIHLFTKRKINSILFKLISNKKVANLIFNLTHNESNSLTQLDYNYLKNKINSK